MDSQKSPKLRVVQTSGSTVPLQYAALSYCWGGDQALKLMSHNSTEFSHDLPLNALPATLRDAITICVSLNISFLWVDSLCIIQDDEVFKLQEIAEMSRIYKHAQLTICASSAASATEGFLSPRQSPFIKDQVFKFPCYSEDGVESSIFAGYLSAMAMSKYDNDNEEERLPGPRPALRSSGPGLEALREPLDRRGWALQEQLLSNRVIFFKRNQLQWKCQSLPDGEYWVDGFEGNLSTQPVARPMLPAAPKEDDASWSSWKGRAMKAYNAIVEDYSSRDLSVEVDRPLAISGIARHFAEMFGSSDQYVAGLWASRLPWGLLWAKKRESWKSRGPEKYVGPTWSWTSCRHSIQARYWYIWDTESYAIQSSSEFVRYAPRMRIESAPYGAVEEGTELLIRGRLISCYEPSHHAEYLSIVEEELQITDEHGHALQGSWVYERSHTFDHDSDGEDYNASEGKGYIRMELMRKQPLEPPSWRPLPDSDTVTTTLGISLYGLIMAPVEGREMVFRRVGVFVCVIHVCAKASQAHSVHGCLMRSLEAEMSRRNPFDGVESVTVSLV